MAPFSLIESLIISHIFKVSILYTKERLYECLKTLHEICGERPIYCAQGIRSHEDVKFVKDAGADGFILGSSLFNDYDNLEALSETISGFKKASE